MDLVVMEKLKIEEGTINESRRSLQINQFKTK